MYGEMKQILLDVSGLGPDSLHVLVALVIFLMCLFLSRRIGFSLLLVTAFQMANEVLDVFDDRAEGIAPRWSDMGEDTCTSLLLPTLICAFLSLGRIVAGKRAARRHGAGRPMRAGRAS